MSLKYTLVTDGSSDRTLLPILNWLCRTHFQTTTEGQWFDPRPYASRIRTLKERVLFSLELYPCDLLFIHRDAEGTGYQKRREEINAVFQQLDEHQKETPHICVIPVRMTEAWLLFNEEAIRRAAGNPNGKIRLNLPPINEADQLQNPKELLFEAIKNASGLNRHRRKKINLSQSRLRVAEFVEDFSPLRILDAFIRLEKNIIKLRDNWK